MQNDRGHDLSSDRAVGLERWRLRRAHMARGLMCLAVVLLTAMLPSSAGAGIDLGQFCWRLDPLAAQGTLTFLIPCPAQN